ncbi:hypothetical protein SAMN04488528_10418 [Clostridium frigidicarnis]|uniref:Uncharacterized protein n=1 Tax=Clostridium frigidicarnis TaxID=84698 RepID=A0A1I1AS68_9CLOT|nr:hypothetical protein SAMN04488528_10418 [Clostridium frigidicarnis]
MFGGNHYDFNMKGALEHNKVESRALANKGGTAEFFSSLKVKAFFYYKKLGGIYYGS